MLSMSTETAILDSIGYGKNTDNDRNTTFIIRWIISYDGISIGGEESYKIKNFTYKKFISYGKGILLIDLCDRIKKQVEDAILGLCISNIDKARIYIGEFDGEICELFKIGHNILLITKDVKEYIMNQANIIAEIQTLLKEQKLTYFWEYCDSGNKTFFAYTAPELGIIVNERTFEEAVERVVELLEYSKADYDKNCNPQDEPERALIDKVYSLYKSNKIEFLNLLGLNKKTQLQGELINAT